MKILISAGGTGGHIYPGLAIIDKFREKEKDLSVLYVGTTNRMEKDIIPSLGIDYVGIEIYGLTKNIIRDIKDIYLIKKNTKKLINIMKEYKPDVVLGIGGYVTYPTILAAHKLNIPIFIHEQNAIPGKVNKLTSKYANLIGVSFEESMKYFDSKKVFYSGNPVSERALNSKEIKPSSLGLSDNKRLIVVVAGSLGSSTINNKMKEFLKNMDSKPYQVVYITGKTLYDSFMDTKYPNNVKVLPYLENLPGLLKNADILISRAGASTIAEIKALCLPTIFIPSPYVANNHQYYNALDLKNNNLADMIEEKDLNVDVLDKKIDSMLKVDNYKKYKDNLNKLPKINSSELIYNKIKELINNE